MLDYIEHFLENLNDLLRYVTEKYGERPKSVHLSFEDDEFVVYISFELKTGYIILKMTKEGEIEEFDSTF